jgi:hypothetical protein
LWHQLAEYLYFEAFFFSGLSHLTCTACVAVGAVDVCAVQRVHHEQQALRFFLDKRPFTPLLLKASTNKSYVYSIHIRFTHEQLKLKLKRDYRFNHQGFDIAAIR